MVKSVSWERVVLEVGQIYAWMVEFVIGIFGIGVKICWDAII